jgi:hypothetical protein
LQKQMACAVKIQRIVASWVKWKKYKRFKALCMNSIEIIQRMWRGHCGRYMARHERMEVVCIFSAITIQKLFRGCMARFLAQAKYEIESTAVVELQRVWRGKLGRRLHSHAVQEDLTAQEEAYRCIEHSYCHYSWHCLNSFHVCTTPPPLSLAQKNCQGEV